MVRSEEWKRSLNGVPAQSLSEQRCVNPEVFQKTARSSCPVSSTCWKYTGYLTPFGLFPFNCSVSTDLYSHTAFIFLLASPGPAGLTSGVSLGGEDIVS